MSLAITSTILTNAWTNLAAEEAVCVCVCGCVLLWGGGGGSGLVAVAVSGM